MNKTISVNIGGFVFNIEEQAYQQLYNYLSSIKSNFANETEREEIMNDIESRIAEIFQELLGTERQVVMDRDVEQMISIMGRPEDYVSEEFAGQSTQEKSSQNTNSGGQKRLFRDSENATLGGVCSGLSYYFDLDVTIIRLIFVLLTILGGSGILIYLVLLVVIPEARSTSDKLQMKGESINIETIKEHFTKIKNEITEKARSGKFKKTFNETVDKGVRAGSGIFKVFAKVIGAMMVLGGSFALIILFVVFFSDTGIAPLGGADYMEDLPNLLDALYPGSMQSSLVFLAIMLVTLIPVVSIIVGGTKILLNIRKSFRAVAIASSLAWFTGVGILVVTGINLGMSMRNETSVEYELSVEDSSDVFYISVTHDEIFSDHIHLDDVWNQSEMIRIQDDKLYYGFPELKLSEKTDSGNVEVIVRKSSNGISSQDAIVKAENIDYPVVLKDNHLVLNPWYSVPLTDKIRHQNVEVEVKIPVGKKVVLGEQIDRIDLDVPGYHRYDEQSFENTSWLVQHKKIICVECSKDRKIYER